MRILMILENDFPPDHRVEKEALSLIKLGHTVAIASLSFKKAPFLKEYRNIILHKRYISKFLYKTSALALRVPFYFNFWRRYILDIYREFPFDVLHVHDLPLSKTGGIIKNKLGVKLIIDLHENYPALVDASPYSKKFPGNLLISISQWRAYERKYLKSADLLITVIREMSDRICQLGCEKDRIYVVSNYPDLNELHEKDGQKDEDFVTLFYSGGINYHRGLQVVINGMSHLIKYNRNVRLWIVGTGSYLGELQLITEKLGLNEYVTFFGWKPFDEMTSIQARANIGLIPHLRSEQSDNSSPNKIYEYMYYKKPILSSDCRSLVRILNETNAGITYKADSPESFSEACLKMISSDKLNDMGINGHRAVMESLNWREAEKELYAAYNQLIKEVSAKN